MKYTDYKSLYETMIINNDVLHQLDLICNRYAIYKNIYNDVSKIVNIPSTVIFSIHQMESSGDFSKHLHNGDSLAERTIHIPQGRPRTGSPPFTWAESAIDALLDRHPPQGHLWDIPAKLYFLEKYNGFGYRKHGINSPYLWAGSNHYKFGKFTADGNFDISAISKQIGAALIIKTLQNKGYTI